MANIFRRSLPICLGVLLVWSGLQGQNNKPDLIFELNVDNDMTYFTDHYFSNGISLKVYAPFMEKSPLNKTIKIEIAQEVTSPSFQTGLWHRWAYISLMFGI